MPRTNERVENYEEIAFRAPSVGEVFGWGGRVGQGGSGYVGLLRTDESISDARPILRPKRGYTPVDPTVIEALRQLGWVPEGSQMPAEVANRIFAQALANVENYYLPKKAKARKGKRMDGLTEAVAILPPRLKKIIMPMVDDPEMNEGITAMMGRTGFATPTAALFAGLGMDPASANYLDDELDKWWSENTDKKTWNGTARVVPEIIVGGGLHAAIYCAIRARQGKPKPIVLERNSRVGGAFAVSKGPSFYLNSRNRPGALSIPGREGALNVLPGALLQPSDLGSEEYQPNTILAWVIRTTLAAFGEVLSGVKVLEVGIGSGGTFRVNTNLGLLKSRRVLIATGLNDERKFEASTDRVMTFNDLMGKMDERFPFEGMKRIAVIGNGDGAKTAIEALTGQGPSMSWSVANLDWIDEIDWYGGSAMPLDRANFEACNRSRYKGLGRLLPSGAGKPFRVQPIQAVVSNVAAGYDSVLVDERPYDYVIDCRGYIEGATVEYNRDNYYVLDGRQLAMRMDGREVYAIGPCGNIPLTARETTALGQAAQVPENVTSMFRYASKTAALAAILD